MVQPITPIEELGAEGAAELVRRLHDSIKSWPDEITTGTTFRLEPNDDFIRSASVEWSGFPQRVSMCLSRESALALLDIPSARVGGGGRQLQEEYVEWRTANDDRGIKTVDFTTEFREHWQLLAAHQPRRLEELAMEFADADVVDRTHLFGDIDPSAAGTTPADREDAFTATALAGGASDYNNGRAAILCMTHKDNSMTALVKLALAAAIGRVTTDADGRIRSLTCSECIPLLQGAARSGRASDPIIVERFGRLAFEKRRLRVDPLSLHISGFQRTRLRLPDGSVMPPTWMTFSRAIPPRSPNRPLRYQRLRIQAPPGTRHQLSHLTDSATEEPITGGAQLADLVSVAVDLHVGEPVLDLSDPGPLPGTASREDADGCAELRRLAEHMKRET